MENTRAWFGFSLLVALLVLAAGVKAIVYDTLDPDLFWHLRVADELSAQSFPRPLVDDLSFASTRMPWTPYSWLADLAMKRLWDAGGYRAAVAAQAAMSGALVLFIALIALQISAAPGGEARYLPAALAAFIGEFLSLPYLSFRPVTLALVLLAIIIWLFSRDRRLRESSRAVWLVIPLTALLVNIHLYAVFVPLAVAALWIGAWKENRNRLRYGLLFLGCGLACLMTPFLPGVIATAIHYQFGDVMVARGKIAEMLPIYHGPLGLPAVLLVVVVVIGTVANQRRLRAGELLWVAGSLLAVLRLGRFSPVFAILAAPTFAITAPALSQMPLARRSVQALLGLILVLGIVRVTEAFPAAATPMTEWVNRWGSQNMGYPAAATDYLQSHIAPRTGRIISEFTWGGYLEWRMGHKWQVLMDGRTQLFSSEFWTTIYMSPPACRKAYIGGLDVDAAVLPARGSVFKQDLLDMGWKVLFADSRAVLLVPPATSSRRTERYTAALDNAS